ncbi:MAG: hypothetical protein CME80_04425 [Halomonas sp.]|nr:hypothetical protein [Halomonas sp.]
MVTPPIPSILKSTKSYIRTQYTNEDMSVETKWVFRSALKRGIESKSRGTEASLLITLVPVLMVLSLSTSVSAEENSFNAPQIDERKAQVVINENNVQLDSFEEAFAQSRANVALIRQIGDENNSTINQNLNSHGRANLASVYQNGNFNEAIINQEGSNNTGLIHQNGSRHEASITQSGNQLESQINQYGFDSNITISHSGSGYQGISVEQQAFSGNARSVTVENY